MGSYYNPNFQSLLWSFWLVFIILSSNTPSIFHLSSFNTSAFGGFFFAYLDDSNLIHFQKISEVLNISFLAFIKCHQLPFPSDNQDQSLTDSVITLLTCKFSNTWVSKWSDGSLNFHFGETTVMSPSEIVHLWALKLLGQQNTMGNVSMHLANRSSGKTVSGLLSLLCLKWGTDLGTSERERAPCIESCLRTCVVFHREEC